MTAKGSARVSMGAIALSILVPLGNKVLDTSQKIVESKFVKAEAVAKGDSDFKDEVILNAIDRISELEKEVKELKAKQ